jgi:iron complex outermembrane recepter protein
MPTWMVVPARRRTALLRLGIAFVAVIVQADGVPAQPAVQAAARDLTELTPDQLANLEVTTASRKPEKRLRSAAAVYVITRDDIRRSGATTLVEALRLAPGVQVARIDSNKWAVGVRGFASRLSRSLLVMIDGRTVYTPLFAGTYWEAQDTLLEDVDRIEVIRGPGGTLWGANSVNGVINVITRPTRDSQGAFATAGAGTFERGFLGLRYGGPVGGHGTYRIYAKGFDRRPADHAPADDFDAWHAGQAGFRGDWNWDQDNSLRVQGDVYEGRAGQRSSFTILDPPSVQTVEADGHLSGANLLANWTRTSANHVDWTLQTYYDRTNHREPTFCEGRDTFDLDLQRRASYGRHEVITGIGYRVSSGTVESVPTIAFVPPRRTDQLFSGFARDEVSFLESEIKLTVGSKFEHNDYSGFEVQPTAQALWAPTSRQSVWAAFSRAVRTPSRVEHDLTITALLVDAPTLAFARLLGNAEFRPERVHTFELGYRVQPASSIAFDVVAFHNQHSSLLSAEPSLPFVETTSGASHLVVPLYLRNGTEGESYGVEIATDWKPRGWWRIAAWYGLLRLALRPGPDSLDSTSAASTNGSSPRHSVQLSSHMDCGTSVTLDAMVRYVGELSALGIASYSNLDTRLAWRPSPAFELAVVGQNLLSPNHAEFPGSDAQIPRGVYSELTWRR